MNDLTQNEIAMIKAFRAIGECPGCVILWWEAGLKASCEKIKDIAPERVERDLNSIKRFNQIYDNLKEY